MFLIFLSFFTHILHIFYTYQTSGACAGMCACDGMHQMEISLQLYADTIESNHCFSRTRLECHCYCIAWYVNSFIGLCNLLSQKFLCSSCSFLFFKFEKEFDRWKDQIFFMDSFEKNWNIFCFFKRPNVHVIYTFHSHGILGTMYITFRSKSLIKCLEMFSFSIGFSLFRTTLRQLGNFTLNFWNY